MGPADHLEITGAKGGESKPKTPVEAPDSLQSTNIAKILLAVGEGEFDGSPTDRDIYLDNTPIMDSSGNVNFPGVKWEWRPGTVEQDYIQGIPSVENETTVNVELRSDNPFTRALSNTQLSAVRVRMSWPRLAKQDSSGNTNGYRIEYAIDIATDGGAYVEAHLGAVDGKTTNGYQRSVRVNLPEAASGWMLRVRRITPNANSGTVADTMSIAGYTEIIDEKLRYPNTALLYIEFDAQQFQNIPAVTVKCKAKRWPVPTNYDPVNRTYTGVWDGTFKQAWTNNPAFVTYGLCVEDRFGLGKRIKSWMVDKWEMYRIAQYCDQLVPNGSGGQEPRFLCDMNLQGRAEAWTLLRDLSAIYRGMVYWAHGSLFMQADMPRAQDIDYVFTRANVIDGDFVYGGAERNTHYSRALVSYDNPANNYDTDVIPVTDLALQRRYRDRPVEISAIGCTRASEAQRRGKWALLSNSQDRTVTFKTGMEGRIPLPGYVIPVADELVAGRPNGGRIAAAAGRVVTLDRDTPIKAGDRLILNLPNGTAQARTVQSVAGRAVTVTTAYGVQPEPELQWAIDYDDLAVQLFRVLKTTRTQEGDYEITALEFNPSKFAAIDTGAKLDERPISVIPVNTVQPPASVTLSSAHMIDQGIAVSTMTIAWPAVEGAVAYDVEWRKDNGNWIRLQRTGAASVDVVGIYAGAYLARVRAVSSFDITSIWKSSTLTQLNGKEGVPPSVTFLNTESLLFGIKITWGFPPGAEDTQRTELWYSEGTDLGLATKLAELAYPQNEYTMQGLRAGQQFYFWARLVDRTGNEGPFFPVEDTVVSGMASADATAILEQIKDQITESELGQELTDRIDLIDKDGPGSFNERLGEVRSDLNQQMVDVNNSLGQVQSELQQQIDSIADLADSMPYKPDQAYTAGQGTLGEDGKLYQAKVDVPAGNPPPNATYWIDIGQAVQTANGLAARVGTVETSVTELNGEVDAQAQQIDGLRTSIDGKADASTVSSLSNRVTQNEQGLSSQGQALTGVQNSLNTTNQNVTAAQQAAQAAADAAGAKGKVLYQSTAPAVADRLAQNLWIDTTGNANTPKRWNGSTWVAVTDKVATDAAAAAASALSQVATKADASTVQALTNAVSQQGQDITAAGQAITNIDASLTQVGGENLLYNPSFDTASDSNPGRADGWAWRNTATVAVTPTLRDADLGAEGKCQRLDITGLTAGSGATFVDFVPLASNPDVRPPVYEGVVNTASVYIRGNTGLTGQIYLQYKDATGTTLSTDGPANAPLTPTYQRLTLTSNPAPANAVKVDVLFRLRSSPGSNLTGGFVDLDKAQLELGSIATGWRDNGKTNAAAAATNASATTALTGRVAVTEAGLSSASSQLTNLDNSIGDIGGENLFYNPAFTKAASSDGSPEGWETEGPVTTTDSLVTSWLNTGEKAQRIVAPGLTSSAQYKSLRPVSSKRIKVNSGQSVTASIYARKNDSDIGMRVFIQWISTAGAVISAPSSAMIPVTIAGSRVTFSAVAPSGAAEAYVYFRVYAMTSTPTNGTVELARPQAEYGARATGWRDNGQVNAANNSATSAAVDSLTSTVSQQGNTLSSVAGRTTTLENAVNSTTNGLATKASASAVDALSNRVTAAEGVNTSQSGSITELNNNIGAIQAAIGASGIDPAPGCLWQFDSATEGWIASGATLAQGAGFVKITATGTDPQLLSGTAATLSIVGSIYSRVRVRITRRAGAATDWDGQLFYQTLGHGFAASYRAAAANPNLAVGQSAVVEWDMANLTAGGTDWVDNTITRLRLDLGNSNGGAFDVDWIAVGRVAPSASSRAVESLTSTVIQQGDDLSAQAQQLVGLQTSVGNNSASIQQVSQAQSTLSNKVNASYSVKLQVTSAGQYVAAGFGLGIENNAGVLQSTFAVMAERFAVLNPTGTGFVSPFAIQGGQVFMNDAFVRDASITNAKIANAAITSAKIGTAEVDTLRIRGNAVTVPVSVTNNTTVYGAGVGNWIDLAAVAMTLDTPGSIQAMFGCYQGFGSGIRQYRFRLWVNSTLIAEGGGDWADGFPSLQGAVYAGAGQHVISVSWWGENSGVSVSGMNIFAMGAKR
ncbi:TPA: phage tail protein [Pseudomonas putida]|nr:phage tail protein [Pseudomonas putida]HEN8719721.1 phage tail protein [Pseudomonas putida]